MTVATVGYVVTVLRASPSLLPSSPSRLVSIRLHIASHRFNFKVPRARARARGRAEAREQKPRALFPVLPRRRDVFFVLYASLSGDSLARAVREICRFFPLFPLPLLPRFRVSPRPKTGRRRDDAPRRLSSPKAAKRTSATSRDDSASLERRQRRGNYVDNAADCRFIMTS